MTYAKIEHFSGQVKTSEDTGEDTLCACCVCMSQIPNHRNWAQIPPELAVPIALLRGIGPGKKGSTQGVKAIMRIFFTCIAMCIILLSIASAETPRHAGKNRVDISRADGSVQCGKGPAMTLEAAVTQVEATHIDDYEVRAARDGRIRIAMCDVPTGQMHILTIESDDFESVQELGFAAFQTREN